jgi:hypothetical protein
MANTSWKFTGESKKKYNSNDFLRVKPGCNLKVRLIDNPVRIVKVFTNERKCINIDNEEIGRQLKAKYPDVCDNLSVRYACWCIDRENNSLRILDMPMSVAKTFGSRVALVGSKISGVDGCDWAIVTNGKQGKDVRYETVYLKETPLSEAEKQMVEERKSEKDGNFDLTKTFKSYDFAEAEGKLLESA